MKPIHPGLKSRILQAFDYSSPELEREANLRLLGGSEYLPHHMYNQFFQVPEYPATKLVARVQKLADVNPEFRKRAKPLLDSLNEFFPQK
jgi:hypothetical protein